MTPTQRVQQEFRFPSVSPPNAEFFLCLPPFAGFASGWTGTLQEFLSAIRRKEVNLREAPLAAVVDQYLDHPERLGLDEAGEYLEVAASLIDWKARLLLPRDPVLKLPDPREEIVNTLETSARHSRIRADVDNRSDPMPLESSPTLSLLDLMFLLQEVEQMAEEELVQEIGDQEVTVRDQTCWLTSQMAEFPPDGQDTAPWFAHHSSLRARICLFLALLELSKQGRLRLEQGNAFGPLLARTPATRT